MGEVVREFLDQIFDFLLFIAACAYVISSFRTMAVTQNTLNMSLSDKGNSVAVIERPDLTLAGEEVLALLLQPDGIEQVTLDGTVFEKDDISTALMRVNVGGRYALERHSESEGISLIITEVSP